MKKLQTKRPNINNHIAIYFPKNIDNSILEDIAIKEIIDLAGDHSFAMNFSYAIYADHNMIQENLFIPIYNPYYLNTDPSMVILRDDQAYDILELYPYHKYYLYSHENIQSIFDDLKNKFPNHHIELITSIKDII